MSLMKIENLWRIPLAALLVYTGTTLGCGRSPESQLPPPTKGHNKRSQYSIVLIV